MRDPFPGLLLFALQNYPSQVFATNIRNMSFRTKKGKKRNLVGEPSQGELIISMGNKALHEMNAEDGDQKMDFFIVGVAREVVEREKSLIVAPNEVH